MKYHGRCPNRDAGKETRCMTCGSPESPADSAVPRIDNTARECQLRHGVNSCPVFFPEPISVRHIGPASDIVRSTTSRHDASSEVPAWSNASSGDLAACEQPMRCPRLRRCSLETLPPGRPCRRIRRLILLLLPSSAGVSRGRSDGSAVSSNKTQHSSVSVLRGRVMRVQAQSASEEHIGVVVAKPSAMRIVCVLCIFLFAMVRIGSGGLCKVPSVHCCGMGRSGGLAGAGVQSESKHASDVR